MSPDTGYTQSQKEVIEKQELQRAERNISGVKELAEKEDIHAEGIIAEGRPHEVIARAAIDKNIDLLVVGSHGRTGISRFLMGSVTERVIGHADSAVLGCKGGITTKYTCGACPVAGPFQFTCPFVTVLF